MEFVAFQCSRGNPFVYNALKHPWQLLAFKYCGIWCSRPNHVFPVCRMFLLNDYVIRRKVY